MVERELLARAVQDDREREARRAVRARLARDAGEPGVALQGPRAGRALVRLGLRLGASVRGPLPRSVPCPD